MTALARIENPVDVEALPDTAGSVLAHRLIEQYRPSRWSAVVTILSVVSCLLALASYAQVVPPARGSMDVFGVAFIVCAAITIALLLLGAGNAPPVPVPYPPLEALYRTWDELTTALMNSPFVARVNGALIRERDHVFQGVIDGTQKLVLIPVSKLMTHVHIIGGTGGGKTYRGVLPLLIQILRRGGTHVVYIDLKGDPGVLRNLGIEAQRLRLNCKWFSLGRLASYVFNPFCQAFLSLLSVNERVQILLQALGIDGGEGHGPSYFNAIQERLVKFVVQLHAGAIRSFRDLLRFLRQPADPQEMGLSRRDIENATHVVAVLDRLAEHDALNAATGDGTPEPALAAAITIDEILSQPGVTVFNLPATLEPTTARVVARLVTHLLVAAAGVHQGPRVPVIIVLDEAQEALARGLATLLKQARDRNISIWLAHQNLSDLKTNDYDFTGVVQGNTTVKIAFSARDAAGRDYLTQTGGEAVGALNSTSRSVTHTGQNGTNTTTTTNAREVLVPRMSPDAINRLNQDEALCLVDISPGTAYAQFRRPVLVRTTYHVSREEYERRKAAPWPRPNRFTVTSRTQPERNDTPAEAAPPPPAPAPAADAPATPPEPLPAAETPRQQPQAAPAPPRRAARQGRATGRPAAAATPDAEPTAADPQAQHMADYLRKLMDQQSGTERGAS